MSTPLVCDASALVALLLDNGSDGQWAARQLTGAELAVPSTFAFEIANIIRRHMLAGSISGDLAGQAHADLLNFPIDEWPYETVAARSWELRSNLSIYDASYVALAELIETRLVTLDRRISRAPGLRCTVTTPENE